MKQANTTSEELDKILAKHGAEAGELTASLKDALLAWRDAAVVEARKEADDRHALILKKFKKLLAAIFAVRFYLDKPYPDDKRWTPYTRFVGPRLEMLKAAITNGEDIGDLEGMARVTHKEKGQDSNE